MQPADRLLPRRGLNALTHRASMLLTFAISASSSRPWQRSSSYDRPPKKANVLLFPIHAAPSHHTLKRTILAQGVPESRHECFMSRTSRDLPVTDRVRNTLIWLSLVQRAFGNPPLAVAFYHLGPSPHPRHNYPQRHHAVAI